MKKRVLVVDDVFDDLVAIKEVLEAGGFSVTSVTNGKSAIASLKSHKFDVILIDILMPGVSGYELLRIIREKYNHNIPLVYVSIVPRDEADVSGSDGFVQKPFSPKDLLAAVKAVLKNHKLVKK